MKRQFQASFAMSLEQLWKDACTTLPEQKEANELYDTFDTLQIWQEVFRPKFGELESITHHSNPDDPPDATAQFTQGTLQVEHTIIEPPHVMQAEDIHRKIGKGRARSGVPTSGQFSKKQLEEIMYVPGHPLAWEGSNACLDTRYGIVVSAIQKKIEKHPPGGLLILGAEMMGSRWEADMLDQAFRYCSTLAGAERWIVAFKYRWNCQEYFSVIRSNEIGMKTKYGHCGQ